MPKFLKYVIDPAETPSEFGLRWVPEGGTGNGYAIDLAKILAKLG